MYPKRLKQLMKSTAINHYLEASAKNLEVYDIAKLARTEAPGMYPKRLKQLMKSQEKTMEVVEEAHDKASTAKETASSEHDEVKTDYEKRIAGLKKGRVADDFEAEAADLKTTR